MYRVYVMWQRGKGRSEVQVESRTSTPAPKAALEGWRFLYDKAFPSDHVLLLTHDHQTIAFHRFGTAPGDPEHSPRDITIPQ